MATAYLSLIPLLVISARWIANAEELLAESNAVSNNRQPRHLIQSKLCFKFGICGGGHNQGYGGYQGGYESGHQGGYGNQGYPNINIGISQSQSSASAGGGGYGSGYFPNNYQYNNNHNQGYPGYNRPGNFGNGFGSYNNQFNGNFYGGGPQGGGYGFQKPYGNGFQGPFGNYYDEGYGDEKPVYEDQEDYSRSAKSKD